MSHSSWQVGLIMFCKEMDSVAAPSGTACGTNEIISFG